MHEWEEKTSKDKEKASHHVQSRFLFCKLCRRYISIKSDSFDDLRSEKKKSFKDSKLITIRRGFEGVSVSISLVDF